MGATNKFLGQRSDTLITVHEGLEFFLRAPLHVDIPQELGFLVSAAVFIRVMLEKLPIVNALVAVGPCGLFSSSPQAIYRGNLQVRKTRAWSAFTALTWISLGIYPLGERKAYFGRLSSTYLESVKVPLHCVRVYTLAAAAVVSESFKQDFRKHIPLVLPSSRLTEATRRGYTRSVSQLASEGRHP